MTIGGALTAGLLLLTKAAPLAVAAFRQKQARVEQVELALVRGGDLLRNEPVVRESLTARADRFLSLAGSLFAGASAVESGADMASWVTGLADLRGVRVIRQDIAVDTVTTPLRRLTVRLEVEADVNGLVRWIGQLEAGPRRVVLDELSITALEPGAPVTQSERLRANVALAGWSPQTGTGRQ